jgi:dTDP-glucose 4,6-dehydratase
MDISAGRILVTGADGFIGSHLAEELVRIGCKLRAFVMYNSFNSWGWLDALPRTALEKMEVWAGDIRDPYRVEQAVQGCSMVIHLAALVAIPYSYRSPDSYVDTNVKGTLNILQAARKWGVAKVVHTSTSEVYGTARFMPINEEHPLQPQSPYSASKIGADQMALAFKHSFDLPVAIIRPFNTYGPRQSARAIIPAIITQIAGGQRVVKLGALSPTRNFNYIADTVRGFIAIAAADASIGEVINIGGSYEISMGDLALTIARLMEVSIEIRSEAERLRPPGSEVKHLPADNTKARQLLGWEPQYAGADGLGRGLQATIEWFAQKENLKRYKLGVYNT